MIRACATLAFLATTAFADGNEHTPFHPDPDHIWNRIHEAFYVRVGADGTKYTAEVLDPPLAPKTIFPLTPPAHQTIIAMLDEFLATDAATKISDPLKRAIFQRDIWAVFDWTAKPVAWYSKAGRTYPEKRRALQVRLAKMIQQVALTREEIEVLPDNYDLASSSGLFPPAYDPAMPRAAFLPPGLTQSPEPWLQLSGMKAPEHNEVSMGRSVFLIFCLFPDEPGYLHRLRDFSAPWEFSTYYQKFPSGGGSVYIVNRKLPQFPAGSQFILMRRTLLIDASGALVLSPLTESVQIRVYTTEPRNDVPHRAFSQEVYAFELDRDARFSEK
ncbi:MAG: hypothetical protein IID09_04680, partial [Candidatus Hydrogenedentes bacterium]|nr:hypothetical protein [Candidatus Hydrogenedentota bacterium]